MDFSINELNSAGLDLINPERRLLAAVLKQAILDLTTGLEDESMAAEEWLKLSLDNRESEKLAFSFAWICNQLDFDCDRVASAIRAMPRRLKVYKPRIRRKPQSAFI